MWAAGVLFKMRPLWTSLACLSLLTACASGPDSSRLSAHACTLTPGQPEYPDACTQPVPEYYSVGAYGYYPPLVAPYYPAIPPPPPAPPAKPAPAPEPKPAPRREPFRHCPLDNGRACP